MSRQGLWMRLCSNIPVTPDDVRIYGEYIIPRVRNFSQVLKAAVSLNCTRTFPQWRCDSIVVVEFSTLTDSLLHSHRHGRRRELQLARLDSTWVVAAIKLIWLHTCLYKYKFMFLRLKFCLLLIILWWTVSAQHFVLWIGTKQIRILWCTIVRV